MKSGSRRIDRATRNCIAHDKSFLRYKTTKGKAMAKSKKVTKAPAKKKAAKKK